MRIGRTFFITELELSEDEAQQYADEFSSQKLTGENITIGLLKPNFLQHVNIPFGHLLELEARFKSSVKIESCQQSKAQPPMDKVPRPSVRMDISQLEFDQFKFEWGKYKSHYQIEQDTATSLFFCCTEEVRQQIRVLQTSEIKSWNEERLMNTIGNIVLSKTSPIVHVKQFLDMKQEYSETCQAYLQRLQAKASCCQFTCQCCGNNNSEGRVREKLILFDGYPATKGTEAKSIRLAPLF